ncbi:uncharacterized protein [Littorina saxatilis]|uniref:uncharacterized protein isoform X1 n=1 Tax=Littorina saxatilis TaxID=31220 RepID=UPI0038B61633
MEAKQEHTTTLLFFVLVVCVLSGQAQSVFDIPQCANRGVFTIGRDNQFSITCTGLHTLSNIYWSISSPLTNGTEIRLGECATCYPNCANTDCSNSNSRDYSITRNQSDVTTLTFVDNLEQNEGALIKCSQRNNNTKSQAYCATAFINATHRPQFKLTECTNGVLEILPSQTVNLTCTGLWPGSNIYWSLTGPSTNHTEVRLGDCPLCFPKCSSTPCNIPKGIYSISRHRYDVTVLDNVHLDDGDTITCSQWNNESTAQSTCTIRTAGAYQLPQCQDGQLDVSAVEPWTAIMCEGLRSYHTITWTLTDSANLTTEIAGCNSACYVTTDDVIVSRTEAASELKITGKMLEKNKNIVTCGRQDGATGVSCRLRVFDGPSNITLSGPHDAIGDLDTVTLICTYDEAFPAAHVTWSIQCNNSTYLPQGRTANCSFNLKQLEASGSEVSCTVANSIFPQINRTASYNFHESEAASSAFPLIPAAGGGGAALLLIIIVIVVVVIVASKRKKQRKRQAKSEENVNASYNGNNELEATLVNGATPTNNGVAMTTDATHTAASADNYTYIEIDDNEGLEKSTNDAQQAKRVVIQSDDPLNTQPKGENQDEADFEEYINELYDSTDNAVLINGKSPSSPNPTSPPNGNVFKPAISPTSGLFKIDDENKAGSSVIGPKGDAYTQVYKLKKTEPLHDEHNKAGNSRGEATQTRTSEEPTGRTREQSTPAMTTTLSADDETEYVNTLSCNTTGCPDDTVYVNVSDTSVPMDTNAVNAKDGPNDAQCSTDYGKDMTSRDDEYNRLGFTRPRLQDDPHYSHLSQL